MATINDYRRAAYAADDAFSAELRRVYGARASDMRYVTWEYPDERLRAAKHKKLEADAALREAEFGA